MEENPQLTKQLSLAISTERNTKHFEAEITRELHASQESMEYIISCVCVWSKSTSITCYSLQPSILKM